MTEIKEGKEKGDPRRKLLQNAFINKASRMYALEKERIEGSLKDLSEENYARRYLKLLNSSKLVIAEEDELQAWEYDDYSLRFDLEGTPKGVFVKGVIVGIYIVKPDAKKNLTSLDERYEPLHLNTNIMIEDITDPEEKEMFSTLLRGLAVVDSGIVSQE